jgi:UDP-GlcNAc:undecaprenyl-phosphate GlcNAc-1-phosphate transferase
MFTLDGKYGAWLVAAALLPLSAKIFSFMIPRARRWGLLDRPGGRHIHAMPVAVVGGIGVISTWLIGLGAWCLLSPAWARANFQEVAATTGCALAVMVIGLLDDWISISPRARLAAELLISAATVAFVPSVTAFCAELSPLLGPLVYPLTVIGITGVMNAMNLIDGMDGLAGTMFLSTAATLALLGAFFGADSSTGGVMELLLVPGLICFLRKNWNPAVTFMGDHGSLTIAYLLTVSALGTRFHGSHHGLTDLCGLAAIFSYPVLDMIVCMVRRLRFGLPIATGDRNHLHHRMLRLGLPPRAAVVGLAAWQAAMLLPIFLFRVLPAAWIPFVPLLSAAVAAERLLMLGQVEKARLMQFQARVFGLAKPRAMPAVDSTFVRARLMISLRPLLEAAQYEEKGCLDQMIESLRFFCERKVKGHGFVQLAQSELLDSLVGPADGAPTPGELRTEWAEAIRTFSQTFRLTYSTWSLPVKVLSASTGADDPDQSTDIVEAA